MRAASPIPFLLNVFRSGASIDTLSHVYCVSTRQLALVFVLEFDYLLAYHCYYADGGGRDSAPRAQSGFFWLDASLIR
jgi:hypothetical protein